MTESSSSKDPYSPVYLPPDQTTYDFVLERRRNKQFVSLYQIATALITEAKSKNSYSRGEELYQLIEECLEEEVRYAPDPSKANFYFCLALEKYEEPFRTPNLEIFLLANLLCVYTHGQDPDNMKDALTLVETALDMGILQLELPERFTQSKFRNSAESPAKVFEYMSEKVLDYFGLEFNSDKTGFQQKQA